MKRNFLEYIYYRICNSMERTHKGKVDAPIIAIFLLTQTILFYTYGVYVLIMDLILRIRTDSDTTEVPGLIFAGIVGVYFFLKYGRHKNQERIFEKYRNESQKEKNIWFFIIVLFIIFSLLTPLGFAYIAGLIK